MHNTSPFKPSVRNLDVMFNFEIHISKLIDWFYHLRDIARMYSILSFKDTEFIIHTFVSSLLDLLQWPLNLHKIRTQFTNYKLFKLQQSDLWERPRKRPYTPFLLSIHWLTVGFRNDFKILLITFKALRGLAPDNISELLSPCQPAHSLRSSDRNLQALSNARSRNKGDTFCQGTNLRLSVSFF